MELAAIGNMLFYSVLCSMAAVCALNFPDSQRRDGIIAASALCANWAICYLSWSYDLIGVDISPAYIINHALGRYAVDHVQVWAYADALVAVIIVLVCYKHFWAYVLWGLYVSQLYLHYVHIGGLLSFQAYSYILDLIFVAMIALFMLIGGRGTLDHVSRIAVGLHVRWFRGMGHAIQRKSREEIDA